MSNQKLTAFSFDASGIAPQAAIEIITPGWYHAEITDAEIKATKGRNAGKAASFEYTILDPQYKGRKLFDNVNVQNASAQAQEIGQRQLSAICHATGIIQVSDLAAFIGKQLQIKVKTRKASEDEKAKGYEDRSEPCGYKALEGATLTGSAPIGIPSGPPPIAGPPPVAAPPAAAPVAPPVVAVFPPVVAAPAVPVAPVAPIPTPAPTPLPVAAPAPVQWLPHPSAPGWVYNAADPNEMMQADVAGVPAVPATPAAGDSSLPPWKR
jgi:hypothetical protein